MKTKTIEGKNVILLCLLAMLLIAGCSDDENEEFATNELDSLLWEVKGNGIKKSYLYGTIHVICSEDFSITEITRQKLESSKQIAFEIDFDNPREFNLLIQDNSKLPVGITLDSLLTTEEYATVENFFKECPEIDEEKIRETKPEILIQQKLLCDCNVKSYEVEFLQLAIEKNKEIFGLETIKEAETVANKAQKIPYETQAQNLLETIENFEIVRQELNSLIEDYKNRSLAGIYASTRSEGDEFIIDQRNENWIPDIELIASKKSTFFAFGAAHLGGEKGVINLLRQKGYTVEVAR